jgi:hypothetical protein
LLKTFRPYGPGKCRVSPENRYGIIEREYQLILNKACKWHGNICLVDKRRQKLLLTNYLEVTELRERP